MFVAWELEFTDQAENWLMELPLSEFKQIAAAIDELEQIGPGLGRPFVDTVKQSRHHNMKELRSIGGHLRALFCFDPDRTAVLLLGGDKSHDWKGWYNRNIPIADRLYDQHLRERRTHE